MKTILSALLGALLLFSCHATAQGVPLLINCQGRLFDGEKPINGEVKMTLRLYDQPTGGNLLYEDRSTVRLSDGFYSTYLGDDSTQGSLENALASGTVWLEVTANNVVYDPRERLAAAPFSVVAGGVRPSGVTSDMLAPGSVGASALAPGSVGASQLLDGAVTSAAIRPGSILESSLADGSVTPPKLSQSYWTTGGNISEAGRLIFIGTVDDRPLDMRVNNRRALRLIPDATSPGVIGGHEENRIKDGIPGGTIGGGGGAQSPHRVEAEYGFIGGGMDNLAGGSHAVVAGGLANRATGQRAVIGGGRDNFASGIASTIAGGYSNIVSQSYATVAGGYDNDAIGYVATVGGGWANLATGVVSVVSGGQDNRALGDASAIAGGWANLASGYAAQVAGGRGNRAEGEFSGVGGGTNNVAIGAFSVVPGGFDNTATGEASFAAGRGARAAHSGAFVWADSTPGTFSSSAPNQFLVRAKGNVGIDTDSPDEKLTVNGRVKAAGFVGDGSALTGVIATRLGDGVVRAAQIAADANIPPEAITGVAITRGSALGGVLEGTVADARLKPGTVTAEHLVPNLLSMAIEDSALAGRVASLEQTRLSADSPATGHLVGTFGDLRLREGVVSAALLEPGLIEGILANSELTKKVQVLDELATAQDLLAQQLQEIAGVIDNRISLIGGDLQGSLADLRIRPGTITADHIAKGVLEEAVRSNEIVRLLAIQSDDLNKTLATQKNLWTADGEAREQKLRAWVQEENGTMASSINALETRMTERVQAEGNKFSQLVATEFTRLDTNVTTRIAASISDVQAQLTASNEETSRLLQNGITQESTRVQNVFDVRLKETSDAFDARLTEKAEAWSTRLTETSGEWNAQLKETSENFVAQLATTERTLLEKIGAPSPALTEQIAGLAALKAGNEEMGRALVELADRSLTRETIFAGQVTGTFENLTLAPASVGPEHLVPGLIENALAASPIAAELTRMKAGTLTIDQEYSGDVVGKANSLAIKDAVIQPRHLSPQAVDALVDAVRLPEAIGAIAAATLAVDTVFDGDVTGTSGALKLKEGTIDARHLAPNLLDDVIARSDVSKSLARLGERALLVDSEIAGDVTGTAASLTLRDGVVSTPKLMEGAVTSAKIAPGAIAGVHLAEGSIRSEHLAPGVLAALQPAPGSVMATMIAPGAVGSAAIAKGAITADKIAPGSITPDKLSVAPVTEITLNAADGSLTLMAGKLPALRLLPHDESPNLLFGSPANRIADEHYGVVVGGGGSNADPHRVHGSYSVIGGGLGNQTALEYSTVAGGYLNEAKGSAATVAGGWKNKARELDATVGGGQENTASGTASTISGGMNNRATGKYSTVPGGLDNTAEGELSMAAGRRARALHPGSFVWADSQDADFATTAANQFIIRAAGNVGIDVASPSEKLTVGGNIAPSETGMYNLGSAERRWGTLFLQQGIQIDESLRIASGDQVLFSLNGSGVQLAGLRTVALAESPQFVAGSAANNAEPNAIGAAIGGGGNAERPNVVSAEYGTVSGGFGNRVTGFDGTISGGQDNVAGGSAASIGGGFMNATEGLFPTISGGAANQALGNLAVIAGGFSNKVSGAYASVIGGYQNVAAGDFSVAAGRRAQAAHSGSMVWADAAGPAFASTDRNQFLARATGGVWFYTAPDLSSGVKLNAGSGSWSMLSSREVKDNIKEVRPRDVLKALVDMPVYQWNYKNQDAGVRHIGPTSQDFREAFDLGEDSTHISAVDADGVALAAIKGLAEMLHEKEATVRELTESNRALEERIQRLERLLAGER